MTRVSVLDVFPTHFSVNGDIGNVLTLRRRLEWAGIDVDVREVHPGDAWPAEAPDVLHLGGGTVAAQRAALPALAAEAGRVGDWVDAGMPLVAVAGGFQLAMERVVLPDADEPVPGLGVFAGESRPAAERRTGYVIVGTEAWGLVYGYENLGQAVSLADGQQPLGRVLAGTGNAHPRGTEGAVRGAAVGSRLHGPLLPRNPALADGLIRAALDRRGIPYEPGERHRAVDGYAARATAIVRERCGVPAPRPVP